MKNNSNIHTIFKAGQYQSVNSTKSLLTPPMITIHFDSSPSLICNVISLEFEEHCPVGATFPSVSTCDGIFISGYGLQVPVFHVFLSTRVLSLDMSHTAKEVICFGGAL